MREKDTPRLAKALKSGTLPDLSPGRVPSSKSDARCILCRGTKLLCGKTRCPIMVKFYAQSRLAPRLDTLEMDGASPPGVFVGRMGYPNVYAGPLIPPEHGDTSMMDTPERWLGKSIEDIVDFRFSLVRGKSPANVKNVKRGGKMIDLTRELGMSDISAEVEAEFTKKPSSRIVLDDEIQPFGPSAPLRDLSLGTYRLDQRISRAHFDTDLKAMPAVQDLYEHGVYVSKIQRALSVGAFGIEDDRRFVPTRWSITAVDSMLSKNLMAEVKRYPIINEYRLYESWNLDNRFEVLMLPAAWCYESIEAWFPHTAWNPSSEKVAIFGSYEGYRGRTTYAEIGGCYYAARLAVCEQLSKEKRQAAVILLRESHPGYIMPVGVWNVRENVRNAMQGSYQRFDTLHEALVYTSTRLKIPLITWLRHSKLLQDRFYQRRVDDYLERKP
jgi:hypothetical protein